MTEKMGFEKNRRFTVDWHNERPVIFGIQFRSKEEGKWARYLELLKKSGHIASWEYEPKAFDMKERYRKKVRYTPDFRVTYLNHTVEYHEVKAGFACWQPVVKKFKQLRADYPDERIILVVPYQPKSGKNLDKLEKAKKYVDDVTISGPIFRKLGY